MLRIRNPVKGIAKCSIMTVLPCRLEDPSGKFSIEPVRATGHTAVSIKLNSQVHLNSAEILEQSIAARNRVRIGLSYRPAARLHKLSESIPWNLFLGYLKFKNTLSA
jgi:hypothetical protein